MYKDQDYYPAFITTKLITLLYLRVGIFFYSRVDDRNNSPKGVVLTPKTRSSSNRHSLLKCLCQAMRVSGHVYVTGARSYIFTSPGIC